MSSFMKPLGVLFGVSSFMAGHLLLSQEETRQKLIQDLGKDRYLGLYSLVSVGTFVPTVWFYSRFARGTGPALWAGTSSFSRSSSLLLKSVAAVTFSQAIVQESPISKKAFDNVQDVKVEGINRITRHALFCSLGLLGFGQLFVRGFLSDIIFWSSFPALFVVGSMHQDERMKKELPQTFYDQTSMWPFEAIIEGRQDLQKAWEEMDKKVMAVALISPLFFL